ncbi:CopG family transcriptional regulator [Sinimarinibacterium sp. CAU 1509]|uniref:CopG family ribbon-helix-helix protein n=1 Tax=Sinimarinibacterium sp. CAU 1509 TaxID=2562283 RepID=UPI0010AC3CA0|nr:ribbon-helix-helix protein, CopG family [Sinimarinibacterium sp. CAU 1509]TJY62208.1 CopG family transcriptional regulator [Sinimarinibacterium sp. CAU 1509]
MNFSVHIDEATLERLQRAVDRSGLTRNRIIVTAVQEWLERNDEKDWPEALKAHFRNPAPELTEDALDFQAWRSALPAGPGVRW